MALRYYVSTYRPPDCNNEDCAYYGKTIPLNIDYIPHAEIGESWREFCPTCGDGAGFTLNKIEWDPLIQIDEAIVEMKIQLGPQSAPIGNGITEPYWKHDCDECVYLGSRSIDDNHYDFYSCESSKSDENLFTGIIRNGNAPEDNESYPSRSIMGWSGDDLRDVCDVLKNMLIHHI